MDSPDCGHRIAGEVFKVDDETLEALDILEGVRAGAYYKKDIVVELENGPSEFPCTSYFYPAKPELLALPFCHAYGTEEHALYRPGPIRREIAELCQRVDSHGLCTQAPCAMMTHCLRLLPGDDIVVALLEFARERQLRAAVVLTCVGSTGRTTLRPAGNPTPKVFEGKFEIVSMTGTLSDEGHHLHMSISDPDCNVFGGHMLEGCLVRTTAEIALGLLQGVGFSRPVDARTGYDELSIVQDTCDSPCEGESSKRPRIVRGGGV